MGKIQEAQEVLKALGLPKAQQNEISALTLLVLAQLSEDDAWGNAKRQSLGIHEMLAEMATRYDRRYAENTVVSASLRGVTPIMFGVIARDDHMEDHQTARFIREGTNLVGLGAELAKKAFEQIG